MNSLFFFLSSTFCGNFHISTKILREIRTQICEISSNKFFQYAKDSSEQFPIQIPSFVLI